MTTLDDLRDAWGRLTPAMQLAFAAQIRAVAAQAADLPPAPAAADSGWQRITDCAAVSGIDKSVICRAADSGLVRDNGRSGVDRRICSHSFFRWNLNRIQGGGCPPARDTGPAEQLPPRWAKVEATRAKMNREFEQDPATALRGRCGND